MGEEEKMKITVIGGGSAYTPGLIEGLIKIHGEVPYTELCLMDIDKAKLEIVTAIVSKIIAEALPEVKVTSTLNRMEAITDSNFILCQIRVGGLAGRVLDEKIPLKYEVIGQETVGPGGFAMALRTVPEMYAIAQDIKKYAPEAWLINYSNPSGMVAAMLAKYTDINAISICDVPIGVQHFIASLLKLPREQVKLDYVGLNHLGWFRKVFVDGKDIMPMLGEMAKTTDILAMLPSDDEKTLHESAMMLRIFNKLGVIPSSYLQYYYLTRECLQAQLAADKTRGEVVQGIEKELLAHFKEVVQHEDSHLWKSRGGQWHSELMVGMLSAIYNDKGQEYVVNVINNGCVPGMAPEACVEIPCLIDKRGVRPLHVDRPDTDMLGLMQVVAAYETLTVEAAMEQDYNKALRALNLNPLIPSLEVAEKILNDYIAAHGDLITLR
ncbi:MAG TPA: 6-phospho-beta-glucosidase [Firmicutes bacterium]|jgi:6-phospho-beta-glucosidase|nr:6-phospho-beta-glucosidase [Bacillota bacterium]